MAIKLIVPVLRVADVARSMQWYRDNLALVGDAFPAKAPFDFAILRQGPFELMLRRGSLSARDLIPGCTPGKLSNSIGANGRDGL